jgi:hypothetical protein
MTVAQARALVKSMVAARSIPVRPCIGVAQSAGHRGLLARRHAHRGVELHVAWRRSVEHRLALVVPPGKLAVDQGGTPFLVGVPWSAP